MRRKWLCNIITKQKSHFPSKVAFLFLGSVLKRIVGLLPTKWAQSDCIWLVVLPVKIINDKSVVPQVG